MAGYATSIEQVQGHQDCTGHGGDCEHPRRDHCQHEATPTTAARRPAIIWPRIIQRIHWMTPTIRITRATLSRLELRFAL